MPSTLCLNNHRGISWTTAGYLFHILKYDPQLPWTYIYNLTKVYFSFTWLFASGSIVKKRKEKKLLSATTVNTPEGLGLTKMSFGEDVYIRPWSLNHVFWTYIYVHGTQRVNHEWSIMILKVYLAIFLDERHMTLIYPLFHALNPNLQSIHEID